MTLFSRYEKENMYMVVNNLVNPFLLVFGFKEMHYHLWLLFQYDKNLKLILALNSDWKRLWATEISISPLKENCLVLKQVRVLDNWHIRWLYFLSYFDCLSILFSRQCVTTLRMVNKSMHWKNICEIPKWCSREQHARTQSFGHCFQVTTIDFTF